MSQKAPKFLLNGVQFKRNFFGGRTVQTGVYGAGELAVKVTPIIAFFWLGSTFFPFNCRNGDEERARERGIVGGVEGLNEVGERKKNKLLIKFI